MQTLASYPECSLDVLPFRQNAGPALFPGKAAQPASSTASKSRDICERQLLANKLKRGNKML